MFSKIFREALAPNAIPVSVQRNPDKILSVKCAPIPANVLSCSFVHYLLSSLNLDIDISPKFFNKIDIPETIAKPVVHVSHVKSRRSPKNTKLEYLSVTVILQKTRRHREIVANIAETLSTKLYGLSQKNIVTLDNDVYQIKFTGFLKTYIVEETIDFD